MLTRKAYILFSTLVLAVIFVMLTAALLKMGLLNLNNGNHYKDRMRARQMALGGLNHALELLAQDHGAALSPTYQIEDEGYECGLCINNLLGSLPGPPDVRGLPVPPNCASLVITGWAGGARVSVHSVVSPGIFFQRGVGADGQVNITGPCAVNGIVSMANQAPAGGGIYSAYPGSPAMVFNGPVTASSTVVFEAVPGPNQSSSVLGLPASLQPQVVPSSPGMAGIPAYQVGTTVDSNNGKPLPNGLSGPAGNYTSLHVTVGDARYVNGNLTTYGDINLAGGTLYVKGNLNIYGGIIGSGSVFVDGNTTLSGGLTSLQTSQTTGASLFGSGNIDMEGLNAKALLQSLSTNVTIAHDVANLSSALNSLNASYTGASPGSSVNSLHGAGSQFFQPSWYGSTWTPPYTNPPTCPTYRVVPIPGPSGNYTVCSGDNPVLSLAADLKSYFGTTLSGNPQAQELVDAMDELAYQSRFNFDLIPASQVTSINPDYTVPGLSVHFDPSANSVYMTTWAGTTGLTSGWDDDPLLTDTAGYNYTSLSNWNSSMAGTNLHSFGTLTTDHQARALGGYNPLDYSIQPIIYPSGTASIDKLIESYYSGLKNFVNTHDYNLNWLSTSNFQGLVYSQQNIIVNGNFNVVGAILANGNVTMNGNTTITYDQEFFHQKGGSGPLRVHFVEDL